MKRVLNYVTISLLFIAATSCEQVDELTDLTIGETFTTKLNVEIPQDLNGMPTTFSQEGDINITSNDQVLNNLDRIAVVEINDLHFTISDFSGNAGMITNAQFIVNSTIVSLPDFNPLTVQETWMSISITDLSILTAIEEGLKQDGMINYNLSGSSDNAPTNFNMNLIYDVDITINTF